MYMGAPAARARCHYPTLPGWPIGVSVAARLGCGLAKQYCLLWCGGLAARASTSAGAMPLRMLGLRYPRLLSSVMIIMQLDDMESFSFSAIAMVLALAAFMFLLFLWLKP